MKKLGIGRSGVGSQSFVIFMTMGARDSQRACSAPDGIWGKLFLD
jgi:hypothetical protein